MVALLTIGNKKYKWYTSRFESIIVKLVIVLPLVSISNFIFGLGCFLYVLSFWLVCLSYVIYCFIYRSEITQLNYTQNIIQFDISN